MAKSSYTSFFLKKLSLFSFLPAFWVTCFGNFFEHYDSALYSCLCSFLAPKLSPNASATHALIKAYAIIPLGMLARPFGAFFFGAIAQVYGRVRALQISLLGMAIISLLLALSPHLPSFCKVAFLIFSLGRALQNFFIASEITGGAIYLLETQPTKKPDILSAIYSASSVGGILLASLLVATLGSFGRLEKDWSYLYLLGCVTAFCALAMRKTSIPEASCRSFHVKEHLRTFWLYKKSLAFIALISGFSYANYSMAMIVSCGLTPLVCDVGIEKMMQVNFWLLSLDFLLLPFFGFLCTKINREKVMLCASASAVIFALPLFFFMKGASFFSLILIRIAFVFIGVAFAAPFHSFVQSLLPEQHRYALISFAYAVGCQLLGGPTASFSLWLFHRTGKCYIAGLYWLFLAAGVSLAYLWMILKKKGQVTAAPT